MQKAILDRVLIDPIIKAALAEDLGRAGDITSAALIPQTMQTEARIQARQAGVVSGLDCAVMTFQSIDSSLQIKEHVAEGDAVAPGEALLTISGCARSILTAERVALNFLGHLSGIASLTQRFVAQIAHTSARICDTRKTTPGLRALEKRAVRSGGGVNHRFGLDDAILIKDNHIAVAGSIAAALEAARAAVGHLTAIEIEVDTLEQLDEALVLGTARAILLDNMTPETLREAVKRAALAIRRPVLEASGGVNLQSIAAIAETGVDMISVGALTHSAVTLDLGLDIS